MRRSLLLLPLLLVSCFGGPAIEELEDPEPEAPPIPAEPLELDTEAQDVVGLKMRLSEGKPPVAPRPVVDGGNGASAEPVADDAEPTELSEDQTLGLLARLPDLPEPERKSFAKREDSQPAPRTGAEVQLAWPPSGEGELPPVEAEGPLTVLRRAPEGEVPMVPHLSITFSQPMVAVTSQELAAQTVPVQLDPQPEGRWRWLGTRTLMFDPEPRFPMATNYSVTIPKGTVSALGNELEREVKWTFSTPAPQVVEVQPWDGPHDLEPLAFASFDQAVDERVLPFVKIKKDGIEVPSRPATEAEIAADEGLKYLLQNTEDDRYVVLKPKEPLTRATRYSIEVEKGAPSAEGPRTTERAQSERFWTYFPLAMEDKHCWDNETGCVPGAPMSISFNNPLDAEAFDPSTIEVEPAIERMEVSVSGSFLTISGDTRARTKYMVRIPTTLQDRFGQEFGHRKLTSFRYGNANKSLQGPGKEILVLDPAAPPALSVYSTNHEKLRVRVYEATTDSYAQLSKWMREARYDDYRRGHPPGRKLSEQIIDVTDFERDELVETAIDLAPHLGDEGKGMVFVWVEPSPQSGRYYYDRVDIWALVQVTDIGLTAYVDQDEVLGWATSLLDGKPMAGVELSLLGSDEKGTTDAMGLARLGKYNEPKGPHMLVAKRGDDLALLPENANWWNQYGGWTRSSPPQSLRFFTFDDRRMYRPGEVVSVKGWMRRYDQGPMGQLTAFDDRADKVEWLLYGPRGNKLGEGDVQLTDFGGFELELELPGTPNLGRARLQLVAYDRAGNNVGSHQHVFQIQEFRRPEFEVETTVDPRPYILGEHAYVRVDANYYSGGALPDAPVQWAVRATPTQFTPPNRQGWAFGNHRPFWGWHWWSPPTPPTPPESFEGETDGSGSHHLKIDFLAMSPPRPMAVSAEATVTDVNRQRWTSAQTMTLHPASVYVGLKSDKNFYEKGKPIEVSSIVVDLDGELVADAAVDLRFARLDWASTDGVWGQVERDERTCSVTSADKAQACTFEAVEGGSHVVVARTTDSEGRATETRMTISVAGGKQKPNRNVSLESVVLIPDKEEYRPGDIAHILVQSPFTPASGLMTIRRQGLVEKTPFTVENSTATLQVPITDKHVPHVNISVDLVGDTPRTDDEGNPLDDKADRVAFAAGSLGLKVPPFDRTLTVEVTPKSSFALPGAETAIDVKVTDHAGRPVNAEIALVAVDESVLALTGATLPDPVAVFYSTPGPGVMAYHSRHQVVLADPLSTISQSEAEGRTKALDAANSGILGALQGQGGLIGGEGGDAFGLGGLGTRGAGLGGGGSGYGTGAGSFGDMDTEADEAPLAKAEGKKDNSSNLDANSTRARRESGAVGRGPSSGASAQPMAVRSDFAALALFAGHVNTNSSGTASVPLTLPDSLTRYRLMAVAVDKERSFGAGESNLTARKPLMLRPSPPRFLNFGDRMELPLVVQNQTGQPMQVDLALRVANARVLPTVDADASLATARTAGRHFTVAANDRREVRIPVSADLVGTAAFQVVAVQSGGGASAASDAAQFEFPVWTPATSEAFATYGELDDSGAMVQPVLPPDDAWPQFGGIEVTTSSTQLQALTDALLYLTQYPYECNEQISSRVLAVAALRDVLDAFESEQLQSADVIEASVRNDLDRLVRRQKGNGGFGFWGDSADSPYVSVHVTHTMVRAHNEGYEVDERALDRAMYYNRTIENHIPWWYSKAARWSIIAYSVYVRHLAGEDDLRRAQQLMTEAGTQNLPLEAQAWILPTLHAKGSTAWVDQILRHLENNATETAATAQFVTSYADTNDYVLLHGSRRTDGIILDSLIEVAPEHDLVPKVTRGLLAHRKQGHWGTTQDNSFVLLAMNRYFDTYENETPDFVARVWLGDDFAGERVFKGRSTDRVNIDVPMGELMDPGGQQDLVLAKDGDDGRLYYRIGMRYAPRSLDVEAADYGFAVERIYEPIDDPTDVTRDADGAWRIAAGARVRVRVTMVAPARRYHVALVDPLPGGLEPMNPELAVTGSIPVDPSSQQGNRYWWWRGTWYEHQNLRDERVEAFASLLWDGVFDYTYVATATTPGRYVVPPAKAEEMYHPETFGRSSTDRVIIE